MKNNIRLNRKKNDWIVAMYCDYGTKGNKHLIRASYSLESGESAWKNFHEAYSKHGQRCWQEDKDGNIIHDSFSIEEMAKENKNKNAKIFSIHIEADELKRIYDEDIIIEAIVTHANIKIHASTKEGKKIKVKVK
jgi:hypothetical protein